MSRKLLGFQSSSDWVLSSNHVDLFEKIDTCLCNVDNLEMAASATYHLTANTPLGADHVKALALCYKYSKKYKENDKLTEDAEKAFNKVRHTVGVLVK